MGQINKGTIASISGNTARVVPADASTRPTIKITIPWHLRGDRGKLVKGTAVVYVEFDDFTGLLLERADGEGAQASPMTLLWENPSPDSPFQAQTLALPLDLFDMYMVIAKHSTTDAGTVSVTTKSGYGVRLQSVAPSAVVEAAAVDTATVGYWTATRAAAYASGALSFGNASYSGGLDNAHMIPLFVYGINT